MLKWIDNKFIFVAGDDWYRRRAQDDASVWFKSIARKARRGKNGSTQQGCYAVTPKGELLRFINTSDPKKFTVTMLEALKLWDGVVQDKKVTIPEMKNFDYKVNVPPIDPSKDVLIKVQSRALTEKDGKLERWNSNGKAGGKPAVGHLWIKQAEWQSIVQNFKTMEVGETTPLTKRLIHRIAKFHLIDNTRGEGPAWESKDLKHAKVTLTRVKNGFAIRGMFLLTNQKKSLSHSTELSGEITINQSTARPVSWTMIAYGKHRGEGKYTRNARPGAQPLGFTFEFLPASKIRPIDLVPPQHMRWQRGYWEAEKH